jgi:hypothetical protein
MPEQQPRPKKNIFTISGLLLKYNILKINNMKTYVKLPLIALTLSLSIAACKGNKSGGNSDSSKTDSSATTKVDSVVKPDTSIKDTSKKDTVSKTVVKKTEEKKKSSKKD